MILSSAIDNFKFELLEEMNFFNMKNSTLQCETQRLRYQTMIEKTRNVVSLPVTLFEPGTHVEKTESAQQ